MELKVEEPSLAVINAIYSMGSDAHFTRKKYLQQEFGHGESISSYRDDRNEDLPTDPDREDFVKRLQFAADMK